MAQSKPRGMFAHRRTVRLIVDEDLATIDALKLAKSLPDYAGDIKGIVPLFGGKCFDITLKNSELAVKLAQEGIDFEQCHKPLRLLGQRSIHVSVFVSVEYPDADLLALLSSYGELKSQSVRRLHFTEEGFTTIENGVRVVEFNRITRDIPKRVVVGGLEIGFKYTGQPVTCHRCQSTDHVVKDCPKRRRQPSGGRAENPPPPRSRSGSLSDPSTMDTSASPDLFTEPAQTRSYAEAAQNTPSPGKSAAESLVKHLLSELHDSRRKRGPPAPASSDEEEQEGPKKPSLEPTEAAPTPASDANVEHVEATQASPSETPEIPPTPAQPVKPPGFKSFMEALDQTGWQRSALMKAVHSATYYRCRGLFLYHKHGPVTQALAKKLKLNEQEQEQWSLRKGMIRQDAFALLLTAFQELQRDHKLFSSD